MTDPVPFARGGAYPPRPGNAARPLVDGEPAFRRIAAAVESARASVWVTVAFVERDLVLPGARGTLFDLLDRHRHPRSEEHTSELQSRGHLVCRLLLEKKKYENLQQK